MSEKITFYYDLPARFASEPILWQFSTFYSSIHGWLSLVVCTVGISLNILNVCILKKTSTESASKTNLILIGLALSDCGLMFTYIPYAIYYYIIYSNSIFLEPYPLRDNILWSLFSVIHLVLSLTFHSISIWLTVYLAFYRYIYMSKSVDSIRKKKSQSINENEYKTKQKIVGYLLSKCKQTIWLICAFCIFICMPIYLYPSVQRSLYENQTELVSNQTVIRPVFIYYIDSSQLDKLTNGLIFKLMFYSQALFAKILPCILLIVFITLLVNSLVYLFFVI